jgi:hypothetical protein
LKGTGDVRCSCVRRTAWLSIANPFRRIRRAGFLTALAVALAISPALADSDYPTGLFENSPVVPHGQQYAAPPSGPANPDARAGPDAFAAPGDYCASIGTRTFGSLEEVRRAHAQCDRLQGGPPPPPPGY